MKALKEQTVGLLAHTYLVNDTKTKMLAYRKDSGEIDVFSKPLSFSTRYRKFVQVVDKELETAYAVK